MLSRQQLVITLSPQRAYIDAVLTRPPICEQIFKYVSARSLIRIGKTCRVAHNAVLEYYRYGFNINRHLARFFNNPVAFRSIQARTGTIISGSSTLQFLDRIFYEGSDLDLYLHPKTTKDIGDFLLQEGYRFTPNIYQPVDFEEAVRSKERNDALPGQDHVAASQIPDTTIYTVSGIGAVYSFEKAGGFGQPPLIVQLITAEFSPLDCILSFHSTCVMNLITYDTAYALYPRATFEERRTILFGDSLSSMPALQKYEDRGWEVVQASSSTNELRGPVQSFCGDSIRFVNDSTSWVLPLDMIGVEGPKAPGPSSPPLTWDPVVANSWRLDHLSWRWHPLFYKVSSPMLRYNYLVAHPLFCVIFEKYFRNPAMETLDEKMKSITLDEKRRDHEIPDLVARCMAKMKRK